MQEYLGETAALLTAFCWAANALLFEDAGKRVGSIAVNLIRLFLGLLFLSVFTWVGRGRLLPLDASMHSWLWLSLSGLVGVVLGDLMLFEAFVVAGARVSMLVMCLVPVLTAIISWVLLAETMVPLEIAGMIVTITGVGLVIFERQNGSRLWKFRHPVVGVLLAFGGAVGQAVGLVLSKFGMQDYNAFAATQIRLIAGCAGFIPLVFIMRKWEKIFSACKNKTALRNIAAGSFTGPFLGISLSLLALQYTRAGIASTIMAIAPVIIIPFSMCFFNDKVTRLEVFGAFISIAGVGVYFLS